MTKYKNPSSEAPAEIVQEPAIKLSYRPKPGNPTTCTPENTKIIATLVALGLSIVDASKAAGVPFNTSKVWLAKGREGIQPYKDFLEAMDDAKAAFKAQAVATLMLNGLKGDTKALKWILERRYPKEYHLPSRNVTVNVQSPSQLSNDELTEKLKALLGETTAPTESPTEHDTSGGD